MAKLSFSGQVSGELRFLLFMTYDGGQKETKERVRFCESFLEFWWAVVRRSGVFPVFVVRLSISLFEQVCWSEGSRLRDRYRSGAGSVWFSGRCGDGREVDASGLFSCGRMGSDHVGFSQFLGGPSFVSSFREFSLVVPWGRASLSWFSVGLIARGPASGMKSEVNDGSER